MKLFLDIRIKLCVILTSLMHLKNSLSINKMEQVSLFSEASITSFIPVDRFKNMLITSQLHRVSPGTRIPV